ncbi:MAG: hypothetical protein KAT68_14215 [Bacteroidales bacterium]|nr:hypothetical protein [Bacteroidales bacterium]
MNETEKNLKLLELAINEEQHFLQEHQSRIKFYMGLISTLIAATFAGFLNSKENFHYYALIIGPILILIISTFAIKGTYRLYQRFLEAITVRAKLEQELGLTERKDNKDKKVYWKTEPIISSRHIKSRMNSDSSENFIKKSSNKGYHLWTKYLFNLFQLISIVMMIGLFIIGICK